MLRHYPLLVYALLSLPAVAAQSKPESVQVTPPLIRRAEPPSPTDSRGQLEQRGDELRAEKAYLDALDYYRAALAKGQSDAGLLNKCAITELLLQRFRESKKEFERATHLNPQFGDAYNNLGVVFYLERKYQNAVKEYEKAIKISPDSASYYSNLGAAYFSKKDFVKATLAYNRAVQLDPTVFEHSSHVGVAAQMSSPEDRAHFEYVLAKLFAKQGDSDRSLLYLKRALEEGYKGIDDVYKDQEFEHLRSDVRFTQLMATRPPAIPE
ncbi:MAG TPA: tetratricopeptide repeat protein [Terriglobales bacterium]|nr:tetratricopeptide repeat protein [Terriglobales bacterium]